MISVSRHYRTLSATAIVLLGLALAGCGGASADPTPTATATLVSPATTEPTATAAVGATPRVTGEYEGITFVVGAGSEITFTVEEKLVELPLPNDAVLRTSSLDGEVSLDGGTSAITIDLHALASDQTFRDRYVRRTMFPNDRFATLTVGSVLPMPEGLASGDEASARVDGTLRVKGADVGVTFDIVARDDGDEIFILGSTTVTWAQLQLPTPAARAVTSVEDEIRVEVLLAVTPK